MFEGKVAIKWPRQYILMTPNVTQLYDQALTNRTKPWPKFTNIGVR
jgi:hypothetical protein